MPSFSRNLFGSMDSMMDFDTDATPNQGTFLFPNQGTFLFPTLGTRDPPP